MAPLVNSSPDQPTRSGGPKVPSWATVLLIGLALFEVTRIAVVHTHNTRLLPAMVLFGSLVVPATFLTFVWSRRVRHDVSALTMLAVATVGGCLSVTLSAVVEDAARRGGTFGPSGQLPLPTVAVVEEGAKVLVVLIALLVVVPRTPMNGLMVGVATGTGFAVLETLGYAFAAYVEANGQMPTLVDDLQSRSLFAPATHVAWAGLLGASTGYAMARHWRPFPTLVALSTFVCVAFLHALWDRDALVAMYPLLTVVDLGLLAAALHVSAGRGSSTDEY